MLNMKSLFGLSRAFVLALLGFMLLSGEAAAHSAAGELHRSTVTAESSHTLDVLDTRGQRVDERELSLSGSAIRADEPCSDDQNKAHVAGQCCTVACHAALATPLLQSASRSELAEVVSDRIADTLEGRDGGRTERPPRSLD